MYNHEAPAWIFNTRVGSSHDNHRHFKQRGQYVAAVPKATVVRAVARPTFGHLRKRFIDVLLRTQWHFIRKFHHQYTTEKYSRSGPLFPL